jgi:hypothetical protein
VVSVDFIAQPGAEIADIFFETFAKAPRRMYAERLKNFLPPSGRFGVTKKAMGGSSRGRRSALFFCPERAARVIDHFERMLTSALVTARQLSAVFLQSRIDKRHGLC